jgi:phenylalanyl-tRNA synthetase beta chain
MKFSYNWLQSFFDKKLPAPEKLAEILTLHFAEVEDIRKAPEGGGNDYILDIDVRPNRAGDCLSHIGIAREISAILDYKIRIENSKFAQDKKRTAADFVSVKIEDKGPCARYTARVVSGVKISASPAWMQERLISCGLRPINNIVDIANYVMLETGQPLHAFDSEKIEDKKILVRFAKKGEGILTLDENKYDLDQDILVIADTKKPLAIAGIKGGKQPEIDKNTKTVVIESANFNSQIIRRASQKINLRTDASLRFEHGIDPNLAEEAINRAAFLVQKIAGGKVLKGIIDVYPKKVFPKLIKLNSPYVKSLLGVDIPIKETERILKKIGFDIKKKNSKNLQVLVPTRRIDVSLPEDLIEEVGRICGYEKIPAVFPKTLLIAAQKNQDIFWENLAKDILKESGFFEVYNYSFISIKDAEIFGYKKSEIIEINNPLSADFQYLRPSLIPNLLKVIEKNQKNFQEIKIFELGNTFRHGVSEEKALSGMILGDKFYETKGAINILLNKLGISDVCYKEYKPLTEGSGISLWHPERCAEIKIGGEKIGLLGEISPKILNELKISSRVVCFDISFEKLIKGSSEQHEYKPVSKFPSASRDVAVLVPRRVKVEDVLAKIQKAGGSIIKDVDLFDIYEGNEIPGQKKNLAFHIIYQAEDRTLQSEEIDQAQIKIVKNLEETPEWQVRK